MNIPRDRFTDLNILPLSVCLGHHTGDIQSWGFIEPGMWRNYLHAHSFFEACYAFKGRGTFRLLDAEYPIRTGEVFVAKPGEPHEIIAAVEDPLGLYFWSYTLARPCDTPPDVTDIDALLLAFTTSGRPISADTHALQPTLDALTEEVVRKRPGYRQAIDGLLAKLLIDTARAVVDARAVPLLGVTTLRDHADVLAQTIVRYLRDNYSRPLTVRDIAAQVYLSERHTARLFQRAMGTSIKAYLTVVRLDVAARLLAEQRLSVKEIAQATGYPDVHYFITLFQQHAGCTPASFRREAQRRMAR